MRKNALKIEAEFKAREAEAIRVGRGIKADSPCWLGDASIACERCGKESTVEDWTTSRLGMGYGRGVYQCPSCGYAFQRTIIVNAQAWERGVKLVPVQGDLI